MRDYFTYSETKLNTENFLDYTCSYGHHVDENAQKVLAESFENLAESERILAESEKNLKKARIALSNMEVQNIMTQFAHYTAAQYHEKAFDLFWSERGDVGLSFPGFTYSGRQAVKGYLEALMKKKLAKLEELKANYKDAKVSEELAGAGFSDCLCLCTPYIIFADDAQTAQGVWNLQRIASEEIGSSPKTLSDCWYERWHLDFILEHNTWKIWHMAVREDFIELYDEESLPPGPMQLRKPRTGGDSPPGNIGSAHGPGGMPGMGMGNGLSAPSEPRYPQPYEHFDSEIILSDMTTRILNSVGTVPEYMLHLPFTEQKDPFAMPGGHAPSGQNVIEPGASGAIHENNKEALTNE